METAISKITPRIQDRQLPAHTPSKTSTSTLRGDQLTEEQRRAVNFFYGRLRTVYGSKFKTQFPSDEDVKLSKMEWAGQVMNLSHGDIERGIEKLKALLVAKEKDYLWVNVPLIAALCQPQPEDFGLPSLEDAWLEAQKNSHAVDKHQWSHSAVRIAGKRTGWFEIMGAVSEQRRARLYKSFKGHYEYLASRVMQGEDLKDAQMLLESDKQKEQGVVDLNLKYHDQKQQEEMARIGINPNGGRAEFLKKMRGII